MKEKETSEITMTLLKPTITVKEMRLGQFEFDLVENFSSPIFYVKKKEGFTLNFLYSANAPTADDLVLVENEVGLCEPDRLQAVHLQVLHPRSARETAVEVLPPAYRHHGSRPLSRKQATSSSASKTSGWRGCWTRWGWTSTRCTAASATWATSTPEAKKRETSTRRSCSR